MSRSISTSKAAAAVINAIISMVGLAVSIAPLPLGADGAAAQGDQPPFAVLIVGVVLAVLGLVGSLGIWRGQRWGSFLTIGVRALDGLGRFLPGSRPAAWSCARSPSSVSSRQHW